MAYQVVWSLRAIEDVDEIVAYIARDSATYASIVVGKILDAARSLANFPFSGRIVPEFADGALQEKLVYSYRIIYRVENATVTIATVIHGRRIV